MEIPQGANMILERLEQAGFAAYVVGGCVRDSLLGKVPHDWDVCTSARPEQVQDCFRDFRVLETGIRHGTVTVLAGQEPYEITTFRVESAYSDSRHPDSVTFVRRVEDDLARRDFTVNAMAYSPSRGLVDLFDGQGDLRRKRIRCVGEADLRFQEDALRILRALRFASTYGFCVEEETARSVHQNRGLLGKIAPERIRVELEKLLDGVGAEQILRKYADVICTVIPELAPLLDFDQKNPHHIYTVWEHTIHAVGAAKSGTLARLCLLLHDIGKPACCTEDDRGVRHFYGHPEKGAEIAEEILRRLRFDTETIRRVTEIVRVHDSAIGSGKPAIRRWLNRIGGEQLRLLLEVKEADARAQAPEFLQGNLEKVREAAQTLEEVQQEESCFRLRDLRVGGRDLMAVGIPSGPALGRILETLLQQVMEERIPNEKEPLLREAKNLWEDSC